MSKQLKSGMFWSVFEVIVKRGLDFIVKLILARLLFPEAFGIVGMATVFTSFVQVMNDAGMSLAIIQKTEITNKHLNTAFWTNVIWSILLYSLLSFVIAPLAVNFYNEPILIKIIPVMSLSLLTSALNMVHYALLRKNIEFKKIAFIRNISAAVAAIISIIMAFWGAGVWALVANTVIATIVAIPLYYKGTKWLPKFQWDSSLLKEILSFGLFTTGTMVITNLVGNADYLLLGKWVGASAVGAYTLAYMMTNSIMGQITTMIERVMYPFYSKIQNDVEKMKMYYLKAVQYYALSIFPIMLTIILFGDWLIPLIFGAKWEESILPSQILALATMINTLTSGYNLLFRSVGNPKYEFKIKRITSLYIYLPILVIGIYFYGIIGAAVGVLASKVIGFFVHQFILNKYFKIKTVQLLKINSRLFSICAIVIVSRFLLPHINTNEYFVLGCYTLIFGGLYYYFYKSEILSLVKV